MDLKLKAHKFPLAPGVYLFTDGNGKILYAGRAVSLRRRVLNYFQKNLDPRINEMLGKAKDVKFYQTDNILEAVIMEANLIKKHWPKYNIREKDNRSFIYFIIPKSEYPKPLIVRERELRKITPKSGHIFGPYQSLSLLRNALKIIRRIFPYSTCKPFSGKPCFDYQIGLCPGLCIGAISKEEYQKNITNLTLLLRGQRKKLLKKLQKENLEQAKAIRHIQDVSLLMKDEDAQAKKIRIEGYDISHLAGKEAYGALAVFIDGKPDKTQYRLFKINEAPPNDDLKALEEVIRRRMKHREWHLPDLILIDGGKPQIDYIHKFFQEMQITIPLIGISKFRNDALVFPEKTSGQIKYLAENIKKTLLETRNEAHRFGLKASRRKRRIF